MWDFHPGQFALKVWREERKQAKELCEEARRNIGGVGMKPVDEATRRDDDTITALIIGLFEKCGHRMQKR